MRRCYCEEYTEFPGKRRSVEALVGRVIMLRALIVRGREGNICAREAALTRLEATGGMP